VFISTSQKYGLATFFNGASEKSHILDFKITLYRLSFEQKKSKKKFVGGQLYRTLVGDLADRLLITITVIASRKDHNLNFNEPLTGY